MSARIDLDLVERFRRERGVDLAGSLYAVRAPLRRAAAEVLAAQEVWVHVDVMPEVGGVDPTLIDDLAAHSIGRLDVHLVTPLASTMLERVCRPGVARVTVPLESTPDVPQAATVIREVGAQAWVAIAPATPVARLESCLDVVDGVLVMLIEPGSTDRADSALVGKVASASVRTAVGVDGGVTDSVIDACLAAGARYVVAGRRLFGATKT
jgi:pentose-5-phosphate-3-epimerase